jgi:DNA polymerase III subunit chi
MKEVEFHFNVPDKLAYSCRLLRKVVRRGLNAVVVAEPALLDELDLLLWRFSATQFLPHCLASASPGCLAATPVILAEKPDGCEAGSVLINLGQKAPAEFSRFERFVEVVSDKDEDRLSGRTRWKQYKESGYALKLHNVSENREPG